MAFPINDIQPPLSHPAPALVSRGSSHAAFGRSVQAHNRIDKPLSPSGSPTAHPPLNDRKEPEDLLLAACRTDNATETERLLSIHPGLVAYPQYNDLLSEAAAVGNKNMVNHLLAVRKSDTQGYMQSLDAALKAAVQGGYVDIVRSLLTKEGNSCQGASRDPMTALHIAAIHGYKEIATQLVEAGFNIHANGAAGIETPLLCAIRFADELVVERLLNLQADPNQRAAHTGLSPLAVASRLGYASKLKRLIKHGAKVNGWQFSREDPLCIAALQGDMTCARILVDAGAAIITSSEYGYSALDRAVQNGHVKILKYLLKKAGSVNAEGTPDGGTPLLTAAHIGQLACMQVLLDAGADMNRPDQKGRTILYWAAGGGHVKAVELLLAYGADVQGWNSSDRDPLFVATAHNHRACVRTLLAAGCPIITGRAYGHSALNCAAHMGHADILGYLLHKGISADAEGSPRGKTALLVAAEKGQLSCMKMLLDAGADINHADVNGHTALYYAAHKGHLEAIELLLARGANVQNWPSCRQDPLCTAAVNGYMACVRALVGAGVPIVTCRKYGFSALHYAVTEGHEDVLEYLLQQGISPNTESKQRVGGPLLTASTTGQLSCIRALLNAGAEINRPDAQGRTALYCAAQEGQLTALKVLLSHGAKVRGWNSHEDDPLCVTALNGHMACVQALVSAGVPIVTGRKHGFSALYAAAQNGHVEILRYLLQQGVSINAEGSPTGGTPLTTASEQGQMACIRTLLAAGADVNKATGFGNTALYFAARQDLPEAVALLLTASARVDHCNSEGKTALWVACDCGHQRVVAKLLEAGANPLLAVDAVTPLSRAVQCGHTTVVEQLLATAAVNPLQGSHLSLGLALPKPKTTSQKSPTHNAWQEDEEHYAEIEATRMLQQVRISSKDLKTSHADK